MDADSSYGGSDTAQDSHSGHDNSSSLETTHNDITTTVPDPDSQQQEPNNFYHKNEITLPVNYDEADFQENKSAKQPHYLSTANLNINDTLEHHSNLEEMSKNYKSTSYLNESPRIGKKSDAGVDNPAFQEEEYKAEVKSTFDNNKPYNGDLNSSAMLGLTSPNKNDEPLTEAVNLELINLKPVGKDVTGAYENGTNGMTSIPVKKENDAEIGNPYDEYFVPVNEHRKYMRGEKLYVTMDKRNKKKRNKCLCWGLCLCIVAAAVIIGILAAVGVIGNQGPHPAQEVSARHFGSSSTNEPQIKSAGGIFGLPRDIINETTIPPEIQTPRLTPGPPVITVSSMLPTTETTMIQVPRALESQVKIDNLEFTPALADKNSTEFKELAQALETELKNTLFTSDLLNYGASDIEVKVMDFASGSVVVKYRVTWIFKDGIHNAKDPIDEEMLKKKMDKVLNKHNGFLNTYHIADNAVTVDRILDSCKIDNNGCEFNCSFDYQKADFMCSCPDGKLLGVDQKSCIDEPIESEMPEFNHVHFPEHDYHTTLPPHEPEPSSEHEHHTTLPPHEPSAEPEPSPEHNHHTTLPPHEPSAEPEPTSPDHYGEPSAEPESTHKPEEVSQENYSPEPEPTHKPEEVSHENYIHIHQTETPVAEPTVEPNAEPTTHENKHILEVWAEPTPEPTSEPNPEPTAEPSPEPTADHKHILEVLAEPTAEPSPEPTADHKHILEVLAEPTAEPTPEPNPEPTAEPSPEPTADYKRILEVLAEPTAEPNPEPTAEPSPEPTADHKHILEVLAEPTAEPNTEPTAEPIAEDKHISEVLAEPTAEPRTEPTAEPNPEPTAEPNAEPTAEPSTEPIVEHNIVTTQQSVNEHEKVVPEPTSEPVLYKTEQPVPTSEPVAEPTPEPISEPAPEPTSVSIIDHILMNVESTPKPVVVEEFSTEPVAEPTPEPTVEHSTEATSENNLHIVNDLIIRASPESITGNTEVPSMTTPESKPVTKEESQMVNEGTTLAYHRTEHVPQPAETTSENNLYVVNDLIIRASPESITGNTEVPPTTTPESKPVTKEESQMVNEGTTLPPIEIATESKPSSNEVSSTESITTASSMTSPVPHSSENEFRHNHLTDEIFALPEATTVQEVDKMTTTEKNGNSTIEIEKSNTEESTSAIMNNITGPESEITTQQMVSEAHPSVITDKITSEATTQQMVPDASTDRGNNDENQLIPVSVNEQTRVLQVENNTESADNETILVPLLVNGEPMVLRTENIEINNGTEITTQPPDMAKIFTEIHKVMNEDEHPTELVTESSTNNTHMHMTIAESTENTSAMDNMSPFLPEIDNDTFVNKLHLGEHVIPHIQNETHDDETTDSPPHLDNDQMNYTNPQDSNLNESTLKVVPLEGNENEIVASKTDPESHIIPVVVQTENIITTTTPSGDDSQPEASKVMTNQTDVHVIPVLAVPTTTIRTENQTVTETTEETDNNTFPPEIINNVHSNTYFDNLNNRREENETLEVTPEQNSTNEISTSMEDLIALETTTYGRKIVESGTETSVNKTAATIHAEILDTVTESVHFNSTTILPEPETTTIVTTVPPVKSSHIYEVNEAFVDVTTTEKFFVIAKSTTENPIITKAEDEDLSVVPLEEENETSKRVPHEAIRQLDAESNDSFNDISEEEQIINDKFHHVDSSTDKTEPTDASTEFTKFNKKSYYDKEKPKFEKKSKSEKNGDDEILTTAVPNDKQPHPFSDIRPVTEDFELSGFTRCTYGQFQCVNGTSVRDGSYCIPESDRCDSVNDCSDGSDEIDCIKLGCPNNYQCASGQCLKRHLVCDGIQNCNDGSDETGCDQWTCRFDEFSCGKGSRCLPILWKCDTKAQCPDGSDEYNCPQIMCNDDSFHCSEQNTCVPKSWRCDGKSDCMNAEDEISCGCTSEEFKCSIGGGCIKNNQTCDGTDDCADKSDEWNCLQLEKEVNNKKYLEVKVQNSTWYPVCSENWNQTHSDSVCRQLGYGGSSLTETLTKPEDFKEYLKLKSQLTYGAPILSQLEKSGSCDSLVAVTCQEFTCGSHSTLDVQSARIIGGNLGVETQWPSLTLLYNKKRNLQCTATLIAPTWVTASHACIFDSRTPTVPSDWILYAGSTNFFSNTDNSTTQVGQVKRILSHPQAKFTQFEFTNDVVLVELSKPLTMTRNVSAMCLPDKDIEPRQLCVIAGWGVSKPGEPSKNQYLHYLPVPIIDSEECNSTKHYNGLMSKDKICAGYTDPEKTPCYNDEGAPLMCFSDSAGTWELQGILSHHDNCARSKHPAIYTSINEKMRKWLINTIGQKPTRSA